MFADGVNEGLRRAGFTGLPFDQAQGLGGPGTRGAVIVEIGHSERLAGSDPPGRRRALRPRTPTAFPPSQAASMTGTSQDWPGIEARSVFV